MAPFVAIAIIPLVAAVGLSVDSMRGYTVRSQLVHALDAAALAGGRNLDSDTVRQTVEDFFHANFPDGYLGATISGPHIEIDENVERIRVTAEAEIPALLMRIVGEEKLTVSAETEVKRSVITIQGITAQRIGRVASKRVLIRRIRMTTRPISAAGSLISIQVPPTTPGRHR